MDLTHLARQEKDSQTLLEIPENFYEVAMTEISISEQESLLADSDAEMELQKENVLADRRALKNIIDQRIKKVVKAAVSDAYRSKPEHNLDKMLSRERELYNCIIQGINKIRLL